RQLVASNDDADRLDFLCSCLVAVLFHGLDNPLTLKRLLRTFYALFRANECRQKQKGEQDTEPTRTHSQSPTRGRTSTLPSCPSWTRKHCHLTSVRGRSGTDCNSDEC